MKFILRAIMLLVAVIVIGIVGLGVWAWAPDIERDELVARYTNSSSQFVTLPSGVEVHVRDEGCHACTPVVLVHGSNASLHTWERWVEQLGPRWRVISMDMPGHGLTGQTSDGDYTIERAAEIVEEVRVHFDLGQIHLAGNSRGGRIALTYGVGYPDQILSLGLVNASGAPWDVVEEPDEDEPAIYRIMRMPGMADAMRNFLPRSLVEEAMLNAFSDKSMVTDVMVDRYVDLIRHPGNREATMLRYAMPYTTDAYDRADQITVPVQIMWGDEDRLVPVSAAYKFQQAFPGADMRVYPGVGHTPMEEIPEQSATDYENFLFRADASDDDYEGLTSNLEPVVHTDGSARFGYYMPESEIRVGDFLLQNIFMDDAVNVDSWRAAGLENNGVFAPVMIEFVDTSSEWIEGEIGGGYAEGARALPQHVLVSHEWFEFDGEADGLGQVTFRGRYSPEMIDAAGDFLATEEIVLEGRLTIGDQVWDEVRFSWFGGD
jgi:pimeloyl-ACP methyl ester carboxylesterase